MSSFTTDEGDREGLSAGLECGGTTPLWEAATRRGKDKRGRARALQTGGRA